MAHLSVGGCDMAHLSAGGCDMAHLSAAERSYPCPRSGAAAEKSYPTSEVSGGWEKTPRVRGQGRPGEATLPLRPGLVALRSHPALEARGGGWEEQPEGRWLHGHRRA